MESIMTYILDLILCVLGGTIFLGSFIFLVYLLFVVHKNYR